MEGGRGKETQKAEDIVQPSTAPVERHTTRASQTVLSFFPFSSHRRGIWGKKMTVKRLGWSWRLQGNETRHYFLSTAHLAVFRYSKTKILHSKHLSLTDDVFSSTACPSLQREQNRQLQQPQRGRIYLFIPTLNEKLFFLKRLHLAASFLNLMMIYTLHMCPWCNCKDWCFFAIVPYLVYIFIDIFFSTSCV